MEEAGVQEVTGHEGDRVILQCQVDSNPEPEYTWIKNGDIFEVIIVDDKQSFKRRFAKISQSRAFSW